MASGTHNIVPDDPQDAADTSCKCRSSSSKRRGGDTSYEANLDKLKLTQNPAIPMLPLRSMLGAGVADGFDTKDNPHGVLYDVATTYDYRVSSSGGWQHRCDFRGLLSAYDPFAACASSISAASDRQTNGCGKAFPAIS